MKYQVLKKLVGPKKCMKLVQWQITEHLKSSVTKLFKL